ncbi:multidrug resistance protein [Thermoplasma volcanium GSS1]|uniref:Multidrug resistance protein n=1 Tax=Thermoplasma volcanium (strain ATCC 51530 / DSM 4299 / JCM 9571 / NBRC 15438 / GSS1) TaxID=273116 RepID=Q97C48_THEVO|nr:MFS transporter [Thermoplasma volcanium]BAB59399.1 multidrug resistance protein [Thermoplasma volcanium GSS1]
MAVLSSKDLMFENRTLWGVSTAAAVRSIGYGATWPFMAVYFNEYLHLSLIFVGFIFTLNAALSIVFSLFAGYLSDVIGRKWTLISGSVAGFILYALLALLVYRAVLIASALFVMTAFSGSLVYPSANAIVSDVTTEKNREMGYTVYRIMANLGWAVGPLISSFIFRYGFEFIFLFVAVANLLSTIVSLLYVKRNVRYREAKRNFFVVDYRLYLFSIPVFLLIMVSSQFSVTLPIFVVEDLHIVVSNLGYFYAVNGTVVVIGQYPISKLMSRYPDIYALVFGAIFYSIGYLMVSFSRNLPSLIIDMIIITIGENLTSPNINTVVSKIAPKESVGQFMGFIGMVNQLARAAAPSVGTLILYSLGQRPGLVWPVIDIFGISAAILFFSFRGLFVPRKRIRGAAMQN